MDKKTLIQFIFISAIILLIWEVTGRFFDFTPPTHPPAPEEPADYPREETPTTDVPELETEKPSVEEEIREVTEHEVKEGLEIKNDRIKARWSNRGAGLQSLELSEYRAPYFENESKSVLERPVLTLLSELQEGTYSDVIEEITFITISEGRISTERIKLEDHVFEVLSHSPRDIKFHTTAGDRLGITKQVTLKQDTYHYDTKLEFSNLTAGEIEFEYKLRSAAGIEREMLQTRYLSTAVAVQNGGRMDIDLIRPGDIGAGNRLNESTNIAWTGVLSQYFAAMLWPDSPGKWVRSVESRQITETSIKEGAGRWSELRGGESGNTHRLASLAEDNPNATTVIQSRTVNLPAGENLSHEYRMITVPLVSGILDSYAPSLSSDIRSGRTPLFTRILSLGTITFLAPLMVAILDFFYSIIPNYGVAIILLTLLVRGVLHPLTRSSQISMHKMKKLQPHLQELMKKHGDDKQKMAREQWSLYSKYGVHPMKGCFPMLLQMPVFLALFKTLRTSVQLRQATFVPGWINDLSQPDTVWELPFSLPILGSDLNILPFVMVVAWMMNQHLTPTPSDPKTQQQQKMMKWLPVVFAFMFYNFASGLLLYITCSSFVGAIEHWLIRKKAEGIELVPVEQTKKEKAAAQKKTQKARSDPRNGKKGGKKGWLERIMEAEEQKKKSSRQLRNKKNKEK